MVKKYSVLMENGKVIGVEVDGLHYQNAAAIPDGPDREMMENLLWGVPDFEVAQSSSGMGNLSKVILGVFIAVAVICLSIALISGVNAARSISRNASASGFVVDLVTQAGSDGTPYSYPVVEFGLPDRSRVTVQMSEGSYPPAYEVGQPVEVMYDPEEPTHAYIRSFMGSLSPWIVTMITGFLGAGFAAAAFFARWVMKPSPAPA